MLLFTVLPKFSENHCFCKFKMLRFKIDSTNVFKEIYINLKEKTPGNICKICLWQHSETPDIGSPLDGRNSRRHRDRLARSLRFTQADQVSPKTDQVLTIWPSAPSVIKCPPDWSSVHQTDQVSLGIIKCPPDRSRAPVPPGWLSAPRLIKCPQTDHWVSPGLIKYPPKPIKCPYAPQAD